MSGDLLDALDGAGDIRGRLRETLGCSRAELLFGALAATAGALGSRLLAAPAAAADAMSGGDRRILNFDLQLEYLQAQMYSEALRLGKLSPRVRTAARVVGEHEWAHAAAIRGLLGRAAVPRATFDYGGVTSDERAFVKTAVAFEDLTAALLKWQAVRLQSERILVAVASLHSVEARHAAWLRRIAGYDPVLSAFDQAASQPRMRRLILSTGFVASEARTSATGGVPGFTG